MERTPPCHVSPVRAGARLWSRSSAPLILAGGALLLSLLAPQFAVADEADQVFQQVFGATAVRTRTVAVPLFIDGKPRGEIRVVINGESVQVEAAALLKEFERELKPEIVQRVRALAGTSGNIALAELAREGIAGEFDQLKVELRVRVPADFRKPTTTKISNTLPAGAERAIPPSAFSAYANIRSGLDFVEQSGTGASQGLQPVHSAFDGAVNYRGWVVEGSGSFDEDAEAPFRRGDFRLVRDDPGHMLRYSAGDIVYPTAGFQNFQPLLGLSLARNFALQPYRVTEPRGQTSLLLKSPSKVEVFVNGAPVQTLQLPAGPHNVRDFMFSNGGNDVVLRITDEVGRTETVRLSFFYDTRLLARGEQEFSYNVGVPSRLGDTGPRYDTATPYVSAFHRIGLSDNVTAGLNFQGDDRHELLGAETVWATRFGTFQPDAGISYNHTNGFDYGVRLGYRYADASSEWQRSYSVAVQYRGSSFSSWSGVERGGPAWDFTARYTQRLGWGINAGIGGSYQLSRDDKSSCSANVFLTKAFGRNWFADLSFDRTENFGGKTDFRAYLSLTYFFSDHRQSIRGSFDSSSGTTRGDWQWRAKNSVEGWDGNLGFQQRDAAYDGFGTLRYTGYRGEAMLSHDVTTPATPGASVDNRTSLRLGTAIVFADGQLAVSRPVQDSFAIVAVNPDFKEQKIRIDPSRSSEGASSDFLGPAVVPNLSAYLYRDINVSAPDLPMGYDLGPATHTVHPSYRSGTVVHVGESVSVFGSGVLLNAEGAPVALQSGEVISLDNERAQRVSIFTNRRGKFTAEGLHAGRYELRLFADPNARVVFEIPKGAVGQRELGELRLPSGIKLTALK